MSKDLTNDEVFEEEEEGKTCLVITEEHIKESCKKHDLYALPELNEELFLHYGGFQKIGSLEKYVNLKSIWLNNNAINIIEGLDHCPNLVCLYLQGNIIQEISGLDKLPNLETLNLSHNYITKISGLEGCPLLHTLEIDHNKIEDIDGLKGLLVCKNIGVLNLSDNKLEEENFMEVITELQSLAVLKLEGNPIARTMHQYRRKLISALPNLNFLDSQPVDEIERRCAIVYMISGPAAAIEERNRILDEREAYKEFQRIKQKEINRRIAIEKGIDISHDRYFLADGEEFPSDADEDKIENEKIEKERRKEEEEVQVSDTALTDSDGDEKYEELYHVGSEKDEEVDLHGMD